MFEDGRVVRVGLIGYGYAGKTFHAPLIQSVAGLQLTVVGSSKRDTVLADLPGVTVCSEVEEVATHPEVDLLVIASPNESHYPLAAAALHAGKHVVVDKPFTVVLADARSLVQLAAERGQLLSLFHNRRWDSEVLAAKAIVESGVLGEISHFETHIDRFRPQVRQRWREQTGPGAGLWFDLGPHLIDQAVQLFGLPESINASFAVLRKGGETDDWAHVQLNYRSVRVILHTSLLASGGGPRSLLHGTLGSWAKFGADVQEKQLTAGVLPGSPGFGEDPDPGILYEGGTGKQTRIPAPAVNQAEYYVGIREALWGRQPNPVPPEQASAVMSILDTSFQSGARGRVLPLQLTDRELAAFAPSKY
ncbi:MAG: oxidoreductase domain protein [Edaphobacter sp.]|nr:oxidoreductase domain protein [Edaphobacter sp.]